MSKKLESLKNKLNLALDRRRKADAALEAAVAELTAFHADGEPKVARAANPKTQTQAPATTP